MSTTFTTGDRVAFMRNGHRVVGTIEHVPTGTEVWFRVRTISPIKGGVFEAQVFELEIDESGPTQVECVDKFDELRGDLFGKAPRIGIKSRVHDKDISPSITESVFKAIELPTEYKRERHVCAVCGVDRKDTEAGTPCSTQGCGSGVIECIPQPGETTLRMRRIRMPGTSVPSRNERGQFVAELNEFSSEEKTADMCKWCGKTIRDGYAGVEDHVEGCRGRNMISVNPRHAMSMNATKAGRAWLN